ncbi:MAG: hypothetical protein KKA84_14920 [Bacteroidetes bacterium]|nr:hypothetical protein [Bacteroidota bacterium]
MRITTNSIGNYTPNIQKPAVTKSAVPKSETLKTDTANLSAVINKEEKMFFAEMYPQQKNDVMDYHFYKKSGSMSGVSVGSLLDRRG